MAEAGTNNRYEAVRKLMRVGAGHQATFTKYESRVDDLVAEHSVTSEKLCEAGALLSTLQNKYKRNLRWDAEIELKIDVDGKLSPVYDVSSDHETRMNIVMARLSAQNDNIETQFNA